jgi:hypothetical protein
MDLYQLVYQSVSLVPFEEPELFDLLQRSRAFNQYQNITGLLLYTPDGRFLQVLEGPRDAVRCLYYNRIVRDPRHYNWLVFSEGPCLQRTFHTWSMGFRVAQAQDMRTFLGYVPPDVPGLLVPRPHTRPELMALLQEFIHACETEPSLEHPR